MKPLPAFVWCAVVVLLLPIAACNRGGSDGPGGDKPRVAFVTNNAEAFWTIAEAGSKKAEKEFGVELVFRKPSSGDPAVQKEIIDNLLGQDIKAIAISVIDPKGQRSHLNEVAAKVPVVTQDNDAPDSKRLCYIGTNNYLAGREVGKLVKEALPDGGTIAIFVGQLEPLNARQRRQGVLDELADAAPPANLTDFPISPDTGKYGKYTLFGTLTDQPIGGQKAKENATDALTKLGDEKNLCFIGLWAYNPPAILSAVKDAGKAGQVKIIGFDEDTATLRGIQDGHVYATVVQNPFMFGYEAVKIMADLAKGDKSKLPKDGILFVPHRVVTKDGGKDRLAADAFRKELEGLLNPK